MDKTQIDIKENYLYRLDHELLAILLKDRSSGKNIIWATDNYRNMSFCRRLQSYVCPPGKRAEALVDHRHGLGIAPGEIVLLPQLWIQMGGVAGENVRLLRRGDQRRLTLCEQIKVPVAQALEYLRVLDRLTEACLLEPLRRSLLNYFCSCYCYNYRSLQTDAARRAFRECFQKTAVPCFDIDFSDSAFFYNQSEYRELKELAEAI